MAHPEEPTLPEDTGQRKNKNYTRSTTKFNINADYIKKPFLMQELLMRVRINTLGLEVENADEMMSADCLRAGGIVINKGRDLVTKNDVSIDLSKREMDLLLYLASKPGIVITREELLKQVWILTLAICGM